MKKTHKPHHRELWMGCKNTICIHLGPCPMRVGDYREPKSATFSSRPAACVRRCLRRRSRGHTRHIAWIVAPTVLRRLVPLLGDEHLPAHSLLLLAVGIFEPPKQHRTCWQHVLDRGRRWRQRSAGYAPYVKNDLVEITLLERIRIVSGLYDVPLGRASHRLVEPRDFF